MGCMHQSEGQEISFDCNELNLISELGKPKGRLTKESIAYLDNNEIQFFKASASRNLAAIRYYLKQGVNINVLDQDRTSPLHVASRHGSVQIVEELLNSGAAVDITDVAGWTPLHIAAFFQRQQVCQLLLSFGASY